MANDEQKEIMARNLNYFLKKNRMTNAQLGKKLNIPESTINNWTSAQNYPRIDKIQQLADFFGVRKSDLQDSYTGLESPSKAVADSVHLLDNVVPIVGKVAAGTPKYAIEDITGYMTIPPNKVVTKTMIYLQVSSDSMDRQFPVDSYVLVDTNMQIENGDVAVVKVNGDEATLKQIKFDYENNKVVLIPNSHNEKHFPQVLNIEEDEVRLVGKVIGMFQSI